MKLQIQKAINKGFRYAYTYNGKDLSHALRFNFLTTNEGRAVKDAHDILASEKDIRIYDLKEELNRLAR